MSKHRGKKGKNWAPEKIVFAKNCLLTLRAATEKFVTNTEKINEVCAKNMGGSIGPPPRGFRGLNVSIIFPKSQLTATCCHGHHPKAVCG